MRGDVAQSGETAEGLPEHRPAVDAEFTARRLGVLDDRVRPVAREHLGDGLGIVAGDVETGDPALDRADRTRLSGPPLVEHDHLEVLERPGQPRALSHRSRRARRLESGSALEEDEVGLGALGLIGDDPGEDLDPRRGRRVRVEPTEMVERDLDGHVTEMKAPAPPWVDVHSRAASARRRVSEDSLPRISSDSNSGGETRRPETATRGRP